MRRRRKNRSTWFPVLPTFEGDGGGIGYTFFEYDQTIETGSPTSSAIATALVADNTIPEGSQTADFSTLRDLVQGQTWLCERVVGKIVCRLDGQAGGGGQPDVICCAALAVLPADDQGDPDLINDEYQPLAAQNAYQPWLWRRTWVLGNPNTGIDSAEFKFMPTSNETFGSALDGPHLDTKGGRRMIQREQRLFLVTQCASPSLSAATGDTTVDWIYDLRVLGRMVNAKNRSTFK